MSLFRCRFPFVLASASPRRRELLSRLGFEFAVRAAPEEARPRPGEGPEEYACRAAAEKAGSVLRGLGDEARAAAGDQAAFFPAPVVLAADTIVVLDGTVYGKPNGHAEAYQTLKALAGRKHEVITGCCLLLPVAGDRQSETGAGHKSVAFAQKSKVTIWDCPDQILRAYAESEEPLDKAGAYAVQGRGGFLVRAIEGSWSNVVGLPVTELAEVLLQEEVIHA